MTMVSGTTAGAATRIDLQAFDPLKYQIAGRDGTVAKSRAAPTRRRSAAARATFRLGIAG